MTPFQQLFSSFTIYFLFLHFRSPSLSMASDFFSSEFAPPSSRVSVFVVVNVIGCFNGELDGLDCLIVV